MRPMLLVLLILSLCLSSAFAGEKDDWPIEKQDDDDKELTFIGYYFMKSTISDMAPTNEFLKGQVVGRLFGGNTTRTSDRESIYGEQRFMPMFTYTPRLFDGWAKMRMAFEIDWTWGDANYGAGGNFGGAFGADFVNMQTQNLFVEFRPKKNLIINAGLLRFYDNIRVPYYTPVNHLVYKGFRLALFGSDASGVGVHYSPRQNLHLKAGAYQLYENNVEQDDDVQMLEFASEYDLDVVNTIGVHGYFLRDHANGEGGVSILGQGLNSGLSNYNGVFNFDLGNRRYMADVFWLGTTFHGNPLLDQGRLGYNGFAFSNAGNVAVKGRTDVSILGYGANLRLAYKYGRTTNDHIAIDGLYTSGDDNNVSDNKYSGVLTGNNWGAPGAVFFSHGLYLLLPHANVVNRFLGATTDIQNLGYGFSGGSLSAAYDIIPNKFRIKSALGFGMTNAEPVGGGSMMGTEVNLNLRYTLRVFMDLELHAAYLALGDYYDSPIVNGNMDGRPIDPWTVFATLKWIMF
jgi:hypothetical protein